MCEKLGTVSYLDDGEVFIGRDYQNTKSYSEKVAGTIDEEVKALIDQAYDDCKAILEKDGDKLQQVVAYLMEHEDHDRRPVCRPDGGPRALRSFCYCTDRRLR